MAVNFPKKEAQALIESNTNKYLFADEQIEKVLTFYKKRSYASAYGSGLAVSINRGSVTVTLNAGEMTPQAKGMNVIGTGTIEKEKTGFKQLTFYMSRVYQLSAGFHQADIVKTGPKMNVVVTKFTQSWDAFDKTAERGFIKGLVAHRKVGSEQADTTVNIGNVESITSTSDVKTAKNKIVEAAIKMSEIKNADYALDGFDESRITIDLGSILFNRLVDERLIQDVAKDTYSGGFFTIGKMGGFKVRRNEFLGKADNQVEFWDNNKKGTAKAEAVIYTDVTALSLKQMLVSMAGPVANLSKDQGYNIEMAFITTKNEANAEASYYAMVYEPLHTVVIGK